MNGLTQYVFDKNQMNRIFKSPMLDLTFAVDRQKVADMIDNDLSPENLCCDGEISRAQVRVRYAHFTKAAKELKKLDPSVKFYEFA